jgi:large subunit ribosomal protein L15
VFQGGAMPLVRRVPKRGFHNRFALQVVAVNVSDLERVFDAGAEVTPETLKQRSLIHGRFDLVKVLGDGELTKTLKVTAHRFSKTARSKIEQAGGTVVELPGKKPVGKAAAKQAETPPPAAPDTDEPVGEPESSEE